MKVLSLKEIIRIVAILYYLGMGLSFIYVYTQTYNVAALFVSFVCFVGLFLYYQLNK